MASDLDDDDVAALGEESEGEFDAAAAAAQATPVATPSGARGMSPRTRELARAAIAKIAASRTVETDPDDDDVVAIDAPAETSPAAVAALPSAAAASPSPAATQPPAPSLDPEIRRLRDELAADRTALDADKAKHAERVAASDMGTLYERYLEQGPAVIFDLFKNWNGGDEESARDDFIDFISDASATYFKVELPEERRNAISSRRTAKSLRAMKEQIANAEKARDAKLAAAQEEETKMRVRTILTQEMAQEANAKRFPFLAAEENCGAMIFDVAEAAKKKDGTQLSWEEAAKRAEEYLSKNASAWFDRRKHLLAKAEVPAAGGKPIAHQVDRQVQRSSPTSTPQPPSKREEPQSPKRWDPEAHRRATKARYRELFRKTASEETSDG